MFIYVLFIFFQRHFKQRFFWCQIWEWDEYKKPGQDFMCILTISAAESVTSHTGAKMTGTLWHHWANNTNMIWYCNYSVHNLCDSVMTHIVNYPFSPPSETPMFQVSFQNYKMRQHQINNGWFLQSLNWSIFQGVVDEWKT